MMIMLMFCDEYVDDSKNDELLLAMNSYMQRVMILTMNTCMQNIDVMMMMMICCVNVCIVESYVHAFISRIFISILAMTQIFIPILAMTWIFISILVMTRILCIHIGDDNDIGVSRGDDLGDNRYHMHIVSCLERIAYIESAMFDYVLDDYVHW